MVVDFHGELTSVCYRGLSCNVLGRTLPSERCAMIIRAAMKSDLNMMASILRSGIITTEICTTSLHTLLYMHRHPRNNLHAKVIGELIKKGADLHTLPAKTPSCLACCMELLIHGDSLNATERAVIENSFPHVEHSDMTMSQRQQPMLLNASNKNQNNRPSIFIRKQPLTLRDKMQIAGAPVMKQQCCRVLDEVSSNATRAIYIR